MDEENCLENDDEALVIDEDTEEMTAVIDPNNLDDLDTLDHIADQDQEDHISSHVERHQAERKLPSMSDPFTKAPDLPGKQTLGHPTTSNDSRHIEHTPVDYKLPSTNPTPKTCPTTSPILHQYLPTCLPSLPHLHSVPNIRSTSQSKPYTVQNIPDGLPSTLPSFAVPPLPMTVTGNTFKLSTLNNVYNNINNLPATPSSLGDCNLQYLRSSATSSTFDPTITTFERRVPPFEEISSDSESAAKSGGNILRCREYRRKRKRVLSECERELQETTKVNTKILGRHSRLQHRVDRLKKFYLQCILEGRFSCKKTEVVEVKNNLGTMEA